MSDVVHDATESALPAWIDRLPDELLSLIFVYTHDRLVFDTDMDPNNYEMLERPLCTFISHVCRRWRHVAIACQYLWALLPYVYHEWTKASMTRAHSAPLDLRLKVGKYEQYMTETFRLVYPLIPRAKSLHALHWVVDSDYQEEILQALAEYAAPILEELEVELLRDTIEEDGPYPVDGLFRQETPPKLRRLNLFNCSLQFPHSILPPTLTELLLCDSRVWNDIDQMVEFFQNVPLLESFTYQCMEDITANEANEQVSQTYPLRCVPLPRLRSFDVDASLVAGIRIFSYLALPPDAELSFTINDDGLPRHQRKAELDDVTRFGAAALRAHYAEYSEQKHLDADSVEVDHDTIRLRPKLCVSVRDRDPEFSADDRIRRAAVAMYLPTPVLANARTLKVTPDPIYMPLQRFMFYDLAHYCRKVERLCLSGPAPVWFETELHRDHLSGLAVFPRCIEVTIREFDFTEHPGHSEIPAGFDSQLAWALQVWSMSRGTECALSLVLDGCRMGPRTRSVFEEALGRDRVKVVEGRVIELEEE